MAHDVLRLPNATGHRPNAQVLPKPAGHVDAQQMFNFLHHTGTRRVIHRSIHQNLQIIVVEPPTFVSRQIWMLMTFPLASTMIKASVTKRTTITSAPQLVEGVVHFLTVFRSQSVTKFLHYVIEYKFPRKEIGRN